MLTVTFVVLGAAAFHHLNTHHAGALYILDHVNVVPLVTIYVPLLAVS